MAKNEQTASYDQTSSETDNKTNAIPQNQNSSLLPLQKPTTLLIEGPGSRSSTTSHNSFEDNVSGYQEEYLSYQIQNPDDHLSSMDMDNTISQLQIKYNMTNNLHIMEHVFHNSNDVLSYDNMGNSCTHIDMQNGLQSFNLCSLSECGTPCYPQPPSLLNFLQLPTWPTSAVASSLLPSSSMYPALPGQCNTWNSNSVPNPNVPYYLLNQALINGPVGGTVFEVQDSKEENGGQVDNGALEIKNEVARIAKRKVKRPGKHFATERDRRVFTNEKYQQLRSLIPNRTKYDKASIVGDAIGYIDELKKSVEKLETQVEKKRCERQKRVKAEDGDVENCSMKSHCDSEQSSNSSWFQTKSKHNAEVDVRIYRDEVIIKLVYTNRSNCLLVVSKILEELLLDILCISGGMIGEHFSFLFNAKIDEGSTIDASAIANRLIEAVDSQSTITY